METGLNYNNNHPKLYEITLPQEGAVAVKDENNVPQIFKLNQNYPNPFNPATIISFSLPSTLAVKLFITNIIGQIVADPINNEVLGTGKHSVDFNGANLPSGVYIYTIEAGNYKKSLPMVLLK